MAKNKSDNKRKSSTDSSQGRKHKERKRKEPNNPVSELPLINTDLAKPKQRKKKKVLEQGAVCSDVLEDIVPVKKTRKKVLEPEGPRVFDVNKLKNGDKFTFLSPGRGKKSYICTVQGSEVLFERNDKHTYTRHLAEMPEIVRSCQLVCTLV